MMTAVWTFCALALLLVAGKWLRVRVVWLQRLYLPAAVIGGLLGLLWFNLPGAAPSPAIRDSFNVLPGFLINIVFAALFLGVRLPRFRQIWNMAAPQLCFGQLLAWGQYVVGLGLAGLCLAPWFGVPDMFGNLLEIGFEGGHGTVAGLSGTFTRFNWEIGRDLGFTVATCGMIFGVVIGMALVNWAVRRGYVENVRGFDEQSAAERKGIYPHHEQPPAGKQTVFCDSVDSLAWHVAVIGIAVALGGVMKVGLRELNGILPEAVAQLRILDSFPLFPLCMLGGILLQGIFKAMHWEHLIDHGQMQRISGAVLDFLVLSAVASIRIETVTAYFFPLLILIAAGTIWNMLLVMLVARRVFKDAWFERAIAEFGQSMGVTATGLLLLRTVDPEGRTPAGPAFGYKQLLHEPLMGGGFWTSAALVLVAVHGWFPIWLIAAGVVLFWSAMVWYWSRRKKR